MYLNENERVEKKNAQNTFLENSIQALKENIKYNLQTNLPVNPYEVINGLDTMLTKGTDV